MNYDSYSVSNINNEFTAGLHGANMAAVALLGRVELLTELHLTATGCHLSYEITQCYLSPNTSEHTPP